MPLDAVLLKQTNDWIANSSMTQAIFINEKLMPALQKAGLEDAKHAICADDYTKWRSAKCRQINSILNGHTNLPAKWVMTWLACLPPVYQTAARKEMLAHFGVLDIAPPTATPMQFANISDLLVETADVLRASVNIVADGKYDENDCAAEMQAVGNELVDVIEVCFSELFKLNSVRPLTGRAKIIVK